MSRKSRRIAAHYLYTPTELIRWGVITVDAEGTILDIDSKVGIDRESGTEFYSGILIPGMVNAHCHLELSHMKGLIAPGAGFAGFAAGMGRLRNIADAESKVRAASFHDARMYADGVHAVGDISNSDLTFSVKQTSCISYRTFIEIYGIGAKSTDHADKLVGQARSSGLTAGITPHSVYSLNTGIFADSVDGADIVSLHFMESADESLLFEGKGPMHRWYADSEFEYDFIGRYSSPPDRVLKQIPADKKILLVHNTRVTEEVAQLLDSHFGNNATWVLCPRSNDYITGEHPPVDLLRRRGVRIAVGTDSLASNTSLSLIDELRMFSDVPLPELLSWITVNGAKALGLDGLGQLKVGTSPGVVLLSGIDFERMSLTESSVTERLV